MNKNSECPICFNFIDPDKNNCTTSCGHSFCLNCLIRCLQTNGNCPCCRAVLQDKITTSGDEYTTVSDDEFDEGEDDISDEGEDDISDEGEDDRRRRR